MKAEKIIRLRMQNSTFCRRIPVVQGARRKRLRDKARLRAAAADR